MTCRLPETGYRLSFYFLSGWLKLAEISRQINGREDKKELKTELQAMLDSVDYKTMLESNAIMQESINKTLSFSPLPIYWG